MTGLQWNPSIADTIGTNNFVHYSEVSLTQGFSVYRSVPGKRPWVLAAQAPKIGGGQLHGGGA